MRIINLIENTTGNRGCAAQHGLSFYIETEKHKLLMDTGASDLFLRNAEKHCIDLTQVDTVILSHGHYDHGGGIMAFSKINPTARIYVTDSAFGEYYAQPVSDPEPHYIGLSPETAALPQVIRVQGDLRIDSELELFSGIPAYRPIPGSNSILFRKEGDSLITDDFAHEQCLRIQYKEQAFLLSGCAHHGILNIMERYIELYKQEPDIVISGFHLMRKDENYSSEDIEEITESARELKKYHTTFYTGHCTGQKPFEIMQEIMGRQIRYVHSGDEIIIEG